ncbi:MAG: hypothetical protein ABJP90_12370 [Paracoccaceae bacterium]
MFISENGHPFAKQRAAQKLEPEDKAAIEQKQTDERAERLSGLADSKPTIGAEQLGLFD